MRTASKTHKKQRDGSDRHRNQPARLTAHQPVSNQLSLVEARYICHARRQVDDDTLDTGNRVARTRGLQGGLDFAILDPIVDRHTVAWAPELNYQQHPNARGPDSMAPLSHLLDFPKRLETSRDSTNPSESSLGLGATVGIAIAIAFICSFGLASFVYFYYVRRSRTMTPRARRKNWADAMENGVHGTKVLAPKTRFGRVLSVFSYKRQKSRGHLHKRSSHCLADEDLRPRQLPGKEFEAVREPVVELEGGLAEGSTPFFGAEVTRSLSPFEDAHEVDGNGPVLPYSSSARKSVQDGSMTGHYRPQGAPSMELNNLVITMPSTTDAPPAAWHRKRTGPPPPLTIEPPGMHSQSPSDAYSAYSTYATAHSPYEYCSINVPGVPPLPSCLPNDGFGTRVLYDRANSPHSSNSNHSSHPLQLPPSPQTPGSIPSISRSDSGAQEMNPLVPPTPTYSLPRSQPSPQRANVIDATHFECLGPLPDHIPIPSPPHFRTQHQPQQDPFLSPRIRTPENRPSMEQESRNTTISTTGESIQVFVQDPLLHETNPFRPHHSPVNPTFTREDSVRAHSLQDSDLRNARRESTDSLGSNFTVEEEAMIQAQIVKNLDALDKERVMGEMDIVHIPQISERRYSWEN